MKYSYKIFISILVTLALGFSAYGYWLMKEIRSQYSLAIEDSLVDFSNILASYLSAQAKNQKINTIDFEQAFKKFKAFSFEADINGTLKGNSLIDAYVTNEKGIIIFDSRTKDNIGKDYSKWNDVYLSLQGKYGARSTRTNIDDPLSSIFYVSAPVWVKNKIIGVVSVLKPEQSLQNFVVKGRQKIIWAIFLVLLGALLVAALFSRWLTLPIRKLISYAKKITNGESIHPPNLAVSEFSDLASAFNEMRISLEGKKSIESFAQHLTHELKSPLSAIQGAAELLKEDMPKEKKDLFLFNIETEAKRAKKQLEEILSLATLESRSALNNPNDFNLISTLEAVKKTSQPLLEQKNLTLDLITQPENLQIYGEEKLFLQALSSLINNAIEFSPKGGKIIVEAFEADQDIKIFVRDQGQGIPSYAKARIFEKFYSLERPDTGKKSTGLGLSFAKEVIAQHFGTIALVEPDKNMSGANILILLNKN